MIVVRIELHSAITGKITTIGKMVIGNIGGTSKRGNYKVAVGHKGDVRKDGKDNDLPKIWNRPARSGEVLDYPRLSYNVWRLVARAILAAFPEEKPKSK